MRLKFKVPRDTFREKFHTENKKKVNVADIYETAIERVEIYKEELTSYSDMKLFSDGRTSLDNDVKKSPGIQFKNFATLLVLILLDPKEQIGYKHIGYSKEDFVFIVSALDFSWLLDDPRNEDVLTIFNTLCKKITEEKHPFGYVQFTDEWELTINGKIEKAELPILPKEKKPAYQNPWLVGPVIVLIVGASIFFGLFNQNVSEASLDNKLNSSLKTKSEKQLPNREETLKKLRRLKKEGAWIAVKSYAEELIKYPNVEDLGYYYLGLYTIASNPEPGKHSPMNENPSRYMKKINPESDYFDLGMVKLYHYNMKLYSDNPNEAIEQNEALLNYLMLNDKGQTPIRYMMELVWLRDRFNLTNKTQQEHLNHHKETVALYEKIQSNYGHVIDFNNYTDTIKGSLKVNISASINYGDGMILRGVLYCYLNTIVANLVFMKEQPEDSAYWISQLKKYKSQLTPTEVYVLVKATGFGLPFKNQADNWEEARAFAIADNESRSRQK